MGNLKYKQAHREAGFCVYCSRPAHPGHSLCLIHIRSHAKNVRRNQLKLGEVYLQSQRDRKKLRRQQGLCPACGAPAEDGYITCYNCREKLYFERFENAAPIV